MKTLKERIENMEQELQKLKKEALQEKWQDKLFQPSKGKYYYIISARDKGFFVSSGSNNTVRKPEHAFKTKEQAELVKERMLLMQEMLAFAHVRNEGWKPVWEDNSVKHGIRYKGDTLCSCSYYHANNFVFGIAVKSIKIAEEMLETFRERLEKYYKKQY